MKKKNKNLGWINESFNYIDSVTMIDKSGTIVVKKRFNPRFSDEQNRIDNQWAVGKNLLEVFPSLSHEDSSLIQALTTGKIVCYEAQEVLNHEGGISITNNITFPIVSRGEILGAIELSRDVTHRAGLNGMEAEKPEKTREKKGKAKYTIDDIVTQSRKMIAIKEKIRKIADSSSSVLIYGETGTGKELIVSAIHNASERKDKPFLALNCAALPESILEGLLFGSQKGAFTGAENKKGMFEEANGGTIYLDEINSMPLTIQAKLLRVLQDKAVTPLGGSKPVDLDVRIIASTNVPVRELVKSGLMRKDILYRINTINIEIPPLRERLEDIILLAYHFIDKYNEEFGKNVKGISKEAVAFLMTQHWHGNVRELEHVIESAMNIMGDSGEIGLEQIPVHLNDDFEGQESLTEDLGNSNYSEYTPSLTESLEAYEKKLVNAALVESHYNVSLAAELLKIPRTSLNYKIKKYGLEKHI
ncbi:MAG: sigma 54-interacting transcriptional regulator [Clostridia bacterium]|nr:sigma 54-interacting transcriptional regulator [Clostridia bacterium]